VRNVRRVHFNIHEREMVREVPAYSAPPKPARTATSVQEEKAQIAKADVATGHVGTAALGCPGGPAVSGRSAAASSVDPTHRKPPATVKDTVDPKRRKIAGHSLR
jgi:hypothetical protein